MDEGRFGDGGQSAACRALRLTQPCCPCLSVWFSFVSLCLSLQGSLWDFLGGLEQHPCPRGLSETVCTSQDIRQAALTETQLQRPQHDRVLVFSPGLVMLVTFLHTPSVAFDYEAEVTAVAMDPSVKRKREGEACPSPWSMDCIQLHPTHFSSARNWSRKHTVQQGRLGNIVFYSESWLHLDPVFLKDPNCGLSPRNFDVEESSIIRLGSELVSWDILFHSFLKGTLSLIF